MFTSTFKLKVSLTYQIRRLLEKSANHAVCHGCSEMRANTLLVPKKHEGLTQIRTLTSTSGHNSPKCSAEIQVRSLRTCAFAKAARTDGN